MKSRYRTATCFSICSHIAATQLTWFMILMVNSFYTKSKNTAVRRVELLSVIVFQRFLCNDWQMFFFSMFFGGFRRFKYSLVFYRFKYILWLNTHTYIVCVNIKYNTTRAVTLLKYCWETFIISCLNMEAIRSVRIENKFADASLHLCVLFYFYCNKTRL